MALPQERIYTIDDINNLPEGQRAELIDGQIYFMAPPSTKHQIISMELSAYILNQIKSKGGACKVFTAPFAVYLDGLDTHNHLEPDISVICNPDLLKDKGCYGPPDWIIEIASPSNPKHDYITKLAMYHMAGVKEYWIINPKSRSVTVYYFEDGIMAQPYTFKDKIKVNIYDSFIIDFSELDI